jgi:hypothetical protein
LYSEFVSLDLVMEPQVRSWVQGTPDGWQGSGTHGPSKYKLDEVFAHEALLLGRKTYEGMAAAWKAGSQTR